jgi:hypothetical protein
MWSLSNYREYIDCGSSACIKKETYVGFLFRELLCDNNATEQRNDMLQYVRKYFLIYYVAVLIPIVGYFGFVYFTMGPSGFANLWTWLAAVGIGVAASLATSRIMNKAAGAEFKRKMKLFYNDCDARLFLSEGAAIASRIKTPFNEWGSLYLCAYSLAYIDIGEREEARKIVDAMRESAQHARKPVEAAHICLNMHAPIKLLYGTEFALQCLTEAEGILADGASGADYEDAKSYIDQERKIDIAENFNDYEEIISLYSTIYKNERVYRRTRVMAARKIAECYRHMGNPISEKEYLEFVVAHGNKLSVVEEARIRLEELPELIIGYEKMLEQENAIDGEDSHEVEAARTYEAIKAEKAAQAKKAKALHQSELEEEQPTP